MSIIWSNHKDECFTSNKKVDCMLRQGKTIDWLERNHQILTFYSAWGGLKRIWGGWQIKFL